MAQTTFSYSGPAVPIPAGVNSVTPGAPAITTVTVSGLSTVDELVFRIDGSACNTSPGSSTVGLDHTWIGDLRLSLRSPAGTTVTLMNRPRYGTPGYDFGVQGVNMCQVVFDDAAGNSIQNAVNADAPFSGSWAPASPLAAFQGEDPNGVWEFIAEDYFSDDLGTVRTWSLIIDAALAPPPPPPPPVPTLSEWAMILLGVLLAGGAALHLSRRRMAA